MIFFKKWVSGLLLEAKLIEAETDIQYVSFAPVAPFDNFDCAIRCKRIPPNSDVLLKNFQSPFIESISLIGNYYNVLFNLNGVENILLDIAVNENYGYSNLFEDQRIVVEHTSMTPVYPVNLATFRSSIIGSSIAATFRLLGAKVRTHYFVEDTARQLNLLSSGVKSCSGEWQSNGKIDHTVGRIFTMAYLLNKGIQPDFATVDRMFPLANKNVCLECLCKQEVTQDYLSDISQICVAGHEKTLNDSFARVDCFDYEYNLLDNVDCSIFANLEETERLFATGTLPYYIKNAVYYAYLKSQSDMVFSVVSSRQREVIKMSLKELASPKGIKVVHFGDVVVLHNGEKKIDSIRDGVFNSVDQYVLELAATCAVSQAQACAAVRYHMLSCRNEDPCVFDDDCQTTVELIKSYSDLLCRLKILRTNVSHTVDVSFTHATIKEILRFEEVVQRLSKDFSYANLITYVEKLKELLEVAIDRGCINRVIADASRRVFENAFRLMGIDILI